MSLAADPAFAAPGPAWQRVSPKLATAWRLTMAFWVAVGTIAAVVVAVVAGVAWLAGVAVLIALAVLGWLWWLLGRRAASFGYLERGDDLLVTSGVLFKRLVIVPYGRMQLVDLVAGPVHRWLGLATVALHTAAATTDATIPGLPPDRAGALRDRLAARGEARSAGL